MKVKEYEGVPPLYTRVWNIDKSKQGSVTNYHDPTPDGPESIVITWDDGNISVTWIHSCDLELVFDSRVKELIHTIGMKRILQDMIDSLDGDEHYVQALKFDFETALRNYDNRYELQ